MSTLRFSMPQKSAPGFLRRQRQALEFGEVLSGGKATPKTIEDLVLFLCDFVTEPTDRKEAADTLWDCSENQFVEMLNALKGAGAEELPPATERQ